MNLSCLPSVLYSTTKGGGHTCVLSGRCVRWHLLKLVEFGRIYGTALPVPLTPDIFRVGVLIQLENNVLLTYYNVIMITKKLKLQLENY